MNYLEEIKKSMDLLDKSGYTFMGQCVKYSGTSMYHTIKHVSEDRRIELPVFEDIQAGMSIGMSLEGLKVCSIYPRWDFMLLSANQLINHADKINKMSDNQFKLKGLIFRTCVGSTKPLFSGEQHSGDYTEAFKLMCKYMKVVKLDKSEQIVPAYLEAMESEVPTILCEMPDLYNEDMKEDLIKSREKNDRK